MLKLIINVITKTTLYISNNTRDFDKSRVSNITVCDSKLSQERFFSLLGVLSFTKCSMKHINIAMKPSQANSRTR